MTLDVRKAQAPSMANAKRGGAFTWFGDVKKEFKKITWTSKDELKTYTKVVVGATFAVGLGIYVIDLLAQSSLSGLSALVKAIVS